MTIAASSSASGSRRHRLAPPEAKRDARRGRAQARRPTSCCSSPGRTTAAHRRRPSRLGARRRGGASASGVRPRSQVIPRFYSRSVASAVALPSFLIGGVILASEVSSLRVSVALAVLANVSDRAFRQGQRQKCGRALDPGTTSAASATSSPCTMILAFLISVPVWSLPQGDKLGEFITLYLPKQAAELGARAAWTGSSVESSTTAIDDAAKPGYADAQTWLKRMTHRGMSPQHLMQARSSTSHLRTMGTSSTTVRFDVAGWSPPSTCMLYGGVEYGASLVSGFIVRVPAQRQLRHVPKRVNPPGSLHVRLLLLDWRKPSGKSVARSQDSTLILCGRSAEQSAPRTRITRKPVIIICIGWRCASCTDVLRRPRATAEVVHGLAQQTQIESQPPIPNRERLPPSTAPTSARRRRVALPHSFEVRVRHSASHHLWSRRLYAS